MTDPIRDWAQKYATALDDESQRRSPAAQRARLLMAYRSSSKRGSLLWRYVALSGAALAMLAVLVFAVNAPKSAEIDRPRLAGIPIEQGTPIEAPQVEQQLTFPQGSVVVWKKTSKGALSKYSESAVEVRLDSGSLKMDVTHQAGRTWLVRAGAFRVYVVGTAFSVDHDVDSGGVEVRVSRGRVRVEGPNIDGGTLMLEPGESFSWPPQMEQPPTATPHEPSLDSSGTASAPQPDPPPIRGSPPKPPESAISWQELARQGEYEKALSIVERLSTSQVISNSTPEEHVLLGNAARYTGRTALARQAYHAARRTPGPSSTLAAYYLAKTDLDTGRSGSEAIRWLRVYLVEAGQGELAASARARLMNLLKESGDHQGAVAVARDYLILHPNGPHVRTARNLVETP